MVERGKERVRDRKWRKRGVRHKQDGKFGVGAEREDSREKIEGKRQREVTEGTRET
jgi:hypothetical protein